MSACPGQLTIGLLALQGAYLAHSRTLSRLGIQSRAIRQQHDLVGIDGLILPGGESTALLQLMHYENLFEVLKAFVTTHPCLATCAGLILLASEVKPSQASFGRLPITVERNAYGRQRESRIEYAPCSLPNHDGLLEMPLIRAPKIIAYDPSVTVHAWLDEFPAMIQYGHTLACTFHPELSEQTSVHAFFAGLCRQEKQRA